MDIYEPHGNHKPKPYKIYKMKRKKSNHNTKEIKRKVIGEEEKQQRMTKTTKKTTNEQNASKHINNHLSIITVNVNGLNVSIQRHRVAEWIKNQTTSKETP